MTNELPVIDADAYRPVPVRNITIDGRSYPVISPLDLPYPDYTRFKNAVEQFDTIADEHSQRTLLRDLICALVPDLPAESLAAASINRLVWLFSQIAKPTDGAAASPGA